MPLFTSFPDPIYIEDLEPSEEVFNRMLNYLKKFEDKNKEQLKDEEKKNITGDVCNDLLLHQSYEFDWLNKEIARVTKTYLEKIGVDLSRIELYAQKSWPVICNKSGGYIPTHCHRNSILSCVYYLNGVTNNTGYLRFEPETCLKQLPIVFNDTNWNYKEFDLVPIKNRLVIFPSSMPHSVTEYHGKEPRFSVSYDLLVTGKENLTPGDYEHFVMHPNLWKTL